MLKKEILENLIDRLRKKLIKRAYSNRDGGYNEGIECAMSMIHAGLKSISPKSYKFVCKKCGELYDRDAQDGRCYLCRGMLTRKTE